jgi:hypothetical protein
MNKQIKRELADFEVLVEEVRGNCDRCKMDCRNRLHILGYQIEALRQERAEIQAIVEVLNVCTLELSQIAKKYDANRIHERLNALIASGLENDKAPQKDNRNRDSGGIKVNISRSS